MEKDWRYIIIFITVFINFVYTFNIDEINSIYYDIDIVGKPIIEDKFGDDTVRMVNRYGQEYSCNLPAMPSNMQPTTAGKDDQPAEEETVDITELLKPMEVAPCLVTKKGWWTYEFCYGQLIKQYHLDDEKIQGAVLILGKYESEYDWSSGGRGGADATDASGVGGSNRLQRFHSQFYTNGTECDLTGEQRRAEVRFKCESDVGDYIERVDEPESCRYIVTVATTRVCHHPYLRPHPSRTPHHISCSPVMTADKFQAYTKHEEEKRVRAEEKRAAAVERAKIGAVTAEDEDEAAAAAAAAAAGKLTIEVFNIGGDSFRDAGKLNKKPIKDSTPVYETKDVKNKKQDRQQTKTEPLTEDESLPSDSAADTDGWESAVGFSSGGKTKRGKKEGLEEEKAPLIKELERIQKKKIQVDNLGSNLGNLLMERLAGDEDGLRDMLAETLAELDTELSVLTELAEQDDGSSDGDDNDGKLDLWRALADRVRRMRSGKLGELLGGSGGKNKSPPEPPQNTVEWMDWRIKKNEKMVDKAQQILESISNKNDDDDIDLVHKDDKSIKGEESETDKREIGGKKSHKDEAAERVEREPELFTDKLRKINAKQDHDMYNKYHYMKFLKEIEQLSIDSSNQKGTEHQDMDKPVKKETLLGDNSENVMLSTLEKSIVNKLKLSGLDINKHKIEVKILSPNYGDGEDDNPIISAQQAHNVETLVFKLVGAHKEELLAKEKQQNLDENYNFSFDEDKAAEDKEEFSDFDEV